MAWLSNTEKGLIALSMYCTHFDHARFKWVPANQRFECPWCGSKFRFDGFKLPGGPAPRNLDRYVLHVTNSNGTIRTSDDGDPVPIQDAKSIVLDERKIIRGKVVDHYSWYTALP